MKKELIQKMLASNNIDIKDLNEFISEYTYLKLNRHISGQELQGIVQAIRMNVFSLRFAAMQAAEALGLNVITATDKNGVIIKTHVYESLQ